MATADEGRRVLVGVLAFVACGAVLVVGLFVGAAIGLGVTCDASDRGVDPVDLMEGGGYSYGKVSWGFWPPGPGCTYTEEVHGFDAHHDPSLLMSGLVTGWAAAVVGLAGLSLGATLLPGRPRPQERGVRVR